MAVNRKINLSHYGQPKVTLGQWPTPLASLPRLGEYLGIHLYIKRDDLTGLGLGGNKTRKLENILGAAISQGCDTIITAGAAQSNHCRQTAAAAAMLGLECHLLLGGSEPNQLQGNLLLDHLFDAQIHWSGEHRKGEGIAEIKRELALKGRKPFVVPYGGSNGLGALAYAEAVHELGQKKLGQKKLGQQISTAFDYLIFASSSGGTHAGLALGNRINPCAGQVIGINIDKTDAGEDFKFMVAGLANEAAQLIRSPDVMHLSNASKAAFKVASTVRLSGDDIRLNSDYLGDGYGVVGDAEREAISLMAKLEGILVDPVYSGRALAGLIGMVRSGEIEQDSAVLFWHTGGAPALFAYSDELK